MLQSIQEKTRLFQQRLTHLDKQPLGKAALVVILFLDLFILISIFDGLADHTRQLASPDQHIPGLCREIVIDAEWTPTNRLGNLAALVSRYNALTVMPDEDSDISRQHPICAPIIQHYKAIRDDTGLVRSLVETRNLQQESRDIRAELERIKGAYDTQLLESIAGQTQTSENIDSIRKVVADKTLELNNLARKQETLHNALEQDPRVNGFFTLIAQISNTDRTALRDELRRLNFWYPAKRLGMEMLFLLPLLVVFYFWNSRSISGNRPFQALVSSHLLVVTLIPVFFKIVDLIYDIIPRKLLRQLIELLESLKLVAIWHYLLITAAVITALALIYLFQKKLFSHEKLMQRRIARGQCQECGLHLPQDSRHCPTCGAAQYRVCSHCNEPTHVHGRFCKACGKTQT